MTTSNSSVPGRPASYIYYLTISKECSNNDGQQFHYYQQSELSPLTLTHCIYK